MSRGTFFLPILQSPPGSSRDFPAWTQAPRRPELNEYIPSEHCELIRSVVSHSPAEEAGLSAGDRIVAINGRRIGASFTITDVWSRHAPGDTVLLTVERSGVPGPMELRATFRARGAASSG